MWHRSELVRAVLLSVLVWAATGLPLVWVGVVCLSCQPGASWLVRRTHRAKLGAEPLGESAETVDRYWRVVLVWGVVSVLIGAVVAVSSSLAVRPAIGICFLAFVVLSAFNTIVIEVEDAQPGGWSHPDSVPAQRGFFFDGIRRFFRGSRDWHDEHEASWAHVRGAPPDGLSPFQIECERRLSEALSARGLGLQSRRVERGDEPVILGEVPALAAEVWIYTQQTDICTPESELCLEEFDTKTPEEHYSRVEEFLATLPLFDGREL